LRDQLNFITNRVFVGERSRSGSTLGALVFSLALFAYVSCGCGYKLSFGRPSIPFPQTSSYTNTVIFNVLHLCGLLGFRMARVNEFSSGFRRFKAAEPFFANDCECELLRSPQSKFGFNGTGIDLVLSNFAEGSNAREMRIIQFFEAF